MKTRLVERGQGIRFVTNSGLQFLSLIQIAFALPTGVIDVDNFEFGIEIQGRRTLFAIADARAFCATEGNVRFTAGRRRVDVGHDGARGRIIVVGLAPVDRVRSRKCHHDFLRSNFRISKRG